MKKTISILMVVTMMILSITATSAIETNQNSVAVGGLGILTIKEDGTLWMEQYNLNQQKENATSKSGPVKITDHATAVIAGLFHNLVIREDNSLWAWGDNEYGGLGNGTNKKTDSPVKIMDDVSCAAVGWKHSLVVKKDNSLWVWGENDDGQLGDGTDKSKNAPIKIMEDVISVAAGAEHSLALKKDGTLWAWGNNSFGQLGDGTKNECLTPIKIMEDVDYISASLDTSFAVKKDGILWGWGKNTYGELGIGSLGMLDNNSDGMTTPVKIMEDVKMVSNSSYTLAVKNDGTLWAWGIYWPYTKNINGTITGSAITVSASPTKIMDQIAAISYGVNPLVIKEDGTTWDFGIKDESQLQQGITQIKIVPVKITDNVKSLEKKSGNSFWNWLKNLFK